MNFKVASLLVATSIFLSGCGNQDEKVRARIAEAAMTGQQAAQAVETFMKKRGRPPAQIEEAYVRPKPFPDIKLLSVDKTGRVQVALAFKPVEGQSLVFVPTRKKDKSFTWRCTSPDIDPKFLPETCR